MMLTLSEAARRAGKDPQTIRRWIREGRLRAKKAGTQHTIDEGDLEAVLDVEGDVRPLPPKWQRTFWGEPMPNWVAAVRRSRSGH